MTFDLPGLLAGHATDGAELHARYLNPQLPRTLRTIGFDKNYVRGEGAYLFDAEGHAYADFLSGFGVFAAGRSHPVIKKALADALEMDFAAWTQFDCPPIQGLLAERLLAKAPGLERGVFCNSGAGAAGAGRRARAPVRPPRHRQGPDRLRPARLPRADHRVAVGERGRGVQGRLRPAAAGHRDPARCPRRARGRAAPGRRGRADRGAGPGARCDDDPARIPARGQGT